MDALTTAYLVAFVAGGAFGVLSWALGAHGHHGHGHGHVHGHGHLLGHGHGHGHGHAGADGHGNGNGAAKWLTPLLNLPAWAALGCIGGAAGYLARRAGVSAPVSVLYAAPSGLVAALAVSTLLSALARGTRYTEPLPQSLVATVLARIGERGTGEVTYVHQGARAQLPARSTDGRAIEAGTEVIVLEVQNGIARVQPSAELLKERGT